MYRLILLAFLGALLAAMPARAQVDDAAPLITPQMIGEFTLDELFEHLPGYAGMPAGRRIEAEILKRFTKSGSDTADLLLAWAMKAMEERNFSVALDVLDQIVILRPGFAEAWNKRATVHYMNDDYSASLSDIRQTLALEPRHFGALSGLGMIFDAIGRKEDAIRVFRRALEINPQLDKVRESLERLEKETAGDEI
ncbi:MAG TPA: tetratricopeptide repeat protein [Propylenella sp.]|jgi:tetratricopeptide (TPR) repeat protein